MIFQSLPKQSQPKPQFKLNVVAGTVYIWGTETLYTMPTKRNAIIVDLDDTIAKAGERIIFYTTEPRNFRAAEAACHTDEFKEEVWDQIEEFRMAGLKGIHRFTPDVIFVTARTGTEICRRNTLIWLRKHGFVDNLLFMRREGDMRPDFEIKRDELHKILQTHEVLAAFDDQSRVLDMFLEEGVPEVFHVIGNTLTQRIHVERSANHELMDTF